MLGEHNYPLGPTAVSVEIALLVTGQTALKKLQEKIEKTEITLERMAGLDESETASPE